MREIKFRAWDEECQRMMEDVLPWSWDAVLDTGSHTCVKSRGEDNEAKFEIYAHMSCTKWKIMQYTGLKDKNGKEIWEGDILKLNGGAEDFYEEVGFEEGCFILRASWINDGNGFPELKAYTIFARLDEDKVFKDCVLTEVVGNIYENKELLK